MSSQVPEGAEIFADWSLYDRVIHFNYMQHREMGEVIRSVAAGLPQPLHVLDLGCGDGRMARGGLSDISVASYVGVDLSQAALEAARHKLADLDCSIELKHSELATALAGKFEPRPNLILASYSLHHYASQQLAGMLGQLNQILAPGGAFIWIDIESQGQEPRDEFLARFNRQQLDQWPAIEAAGIQEIMDHMAEADFPLSVTEKKQLAAAAGLRWDSTPFEDPSFVAHLFSKQAEA